MRQLITRIDEALHRRLKQRAAAEGRSVNSLVTDLLRAGLDDRQGAFREKLRAEGLLTEAETNEPLLSRDEVIESTRGWGRAVSEALEADRSHR
jgi:antitoxin FitA